MAFLLLFFICKEALLPLNVIDLLYICKRFQCIVKKSPGNMKPGLCTLLYGYRLMKTVSLPAVWCSLLKLRGADYGGKIIPEFSLKKAPVKPGKYQATDVQQKIETDTTRGDFP